MFSHDLCFIFVSLNLIILPVSSVKEESIREKKCHEITHNLDNSEGPPLDHKWTDSVKVWYSVMWSKYDKARTYAAVMNKTVDDLSDDEITTHSCAVIRFSETEGFMTMFGEKAAMPSENTSDGFSFKMNHASGKCIARLTDNKSYFLVTTCWDGDEASWAVLSTKPNLDETVQTMVLRKIKKLGFDPKMAFKAQFDNCNDISQNKRRSLGSGSEGGRSQRRKSERRKKKGRKSQGRKKD